MDETLHAYYVGNITMVIIVKKRPKTAYFGLFSGKIHRLLLNYYQGNIILFNIKKKYKYIKKLNFDITMVIFCEIGGLK